MHSSLQSCMLITFASDSSIPIFTIAHHVHVTIQARLVPLPSFWHIVSSEILPEVNDACAGQPRGISCMIDDILIF